ncbi:MAG: PipX family protein [Gloeomargarita sp. DG_2_bins_126]
MADSMTGESYLNHPNFGLLYRICRLGDGSELFMTLYAHRLFFQVHYLAESLEVEPISRNQARMLVENHLRELRRLGKTEEYQKLQQVEKQM